MKHKNWIHLMVVLGLLVSISGLVPGSGPPAQAATTGNILRVVQWGGLDFGNCAVWVFACSLEYALTIAASGTEIWVASGTHLSYFQRDESIQLINGVAIYGGFDGTETSRDQRDPDPATNGTVLSGDIGEVGNVSDNRYHVVTASSTDSTAVLDGFTITAGNANGTNPYSLGGGMYIIEGSPTLRNLIISGNTTIGPGGGMYVNGGSPTLTDVTFSNNSAENAAGMYNYNNSPTLTDVIFSGNSANNWGGGMFNRLSSLTLTDVTFSDNEAHYGGGMYNIEDSTPTLTDVTFSGNSADNYGGGMLNDNSSPMLSNVTFSGNSAIDYGGGMYNYSSSPTLTNVTFSGNRATYYGGGMYNTSSSPTLTNVTFSGNSARNGGGMYNYDSSPTLTDVTFSGNTASYGGGMYNDTSSPTLTNVTFSGNEADYGGGMYNYYSSPTLTNVTFSSNEAWIGGGMFNSSSSPALTDVTFSGNSATGYGGGMYNSSSSPTLTNVTFSGNTATDDGGGMYNSSSSPTLTDVIFSGNSATGYGGGMYNSSSSPTLTNVTFSGNTATVYGGGMYNVSSSSPSVRNSILWNNRANGVTGTITATIALNSSTITLTHSLSQGSGGSDSWTSDTSFVDGGDNLDSDPQFVEAVDPTEAPTTGGDLRLQLGSPAIDAGDNQHITGITTDLDGNPRISGGTVDMGAYEFQFFYTLSVSLAGSGAGSVSSAPAGIDCGTDCSDSYADGTVVTLTASTNTGSTFSGWSGACTNTSGDCLVTMTEAKSVTATFTLNQYLLSVSLAGDGNGSVSSNPTGIDCGTDCSESYDHGTLVTLTASADSGSTFSGWSGACTDTSGDCLVTMSEAKSVTATFTLNQYLLSVSLAGDGNGSVSSAPAGIDCGNDCSEIYADGTIVTLTASADSGSTFSGWSGAGCSGADDCTVTMNAPKEVTATFAKDQPIPPTGPFEVFLPLAQLNH